MEKNQNFKTSVFHHGRYGVEKKSVSNVVSGMHFGFLKKTQVNKHVSFETGKIFQILW